MSLKKGKGLDNPVFSIDEDLAKSQKVLNILCDDSPCLKSNCNNKDQYLTTNIEVSSEDLQPEDEKKVDQNLVVSIKSLKSKYYQFFGISFAILSSIAACCSTFLASILVKGNKFTSWQCTLYRFIGVFIPGLFFIVYYYFYKKKNILKSIWPFWGKELKGQKKNIILLAVRSIVGALSIFIQFETYHFIDYADSNTIIYANSVFVIVISHFFIGEKCSLISYPISFLTLGGILLVAKPPFILGTSEFDMEKLKGIGLSVACMLANAIVFITVRSLRKVHYALIMVLFGLCGLVMASIVSLPFEDFKLPENLSEFFLLFGLSITAFFNQIFLTFSLKFEQVIRTIDIIFSFLLQMIVDVYPDIYSILGACIVTSCVFIIGFRTQIENLIHIPKFACRRNSSTLPNTNNL